MTQIEKNLEDVENDSNNWVSSEQLCEWLNLEINPFDYKILVLINSNLGYLPKFRNGVITLHINAFKRCYPQFNYELKN